MLSKYFCVHACVLYEYALVCTGAPADVDAELLPLALSTLCIFKDYLYCLCSGVLPACCVHTLQLLTRRGHWVCRLCSYRGWSAIRASALSSQAVSPAPSPYFFETGSLTEQKIHQLGWLRPSSGALPVFIPRTEARCHTTIPCFYMKAWNPNSVLCPHSHHQQQQEQRTGREAAAFEDTVHTGLTPLISVF